MPREPTHLRPDPGPAQRARFEALFDLHHAALLRYAVRRTTDPHDAADVVSETFLVVWRRLDDVPSGDSTAAWLYGVARRVLANQRRGAARRGQLSARLGQALEGAAAHAAPAVPSTAGAALAALGEDDRELLMLTAWEGLAPAEIATALGLPGATVRSRLRRARIRFAAELEAAGGPSSASAHAGGHTVSTVAATSTPIQEGSR